MGDFVQRRLPAAFVSAWDAGFEAALAAARSEFGETWRAVWQTGPVWRFALMPGVCGTPAWVGVTGPSVDRVGRGFPMVLACPLTDAEVFAQVVRAGHGWFDALERAYRGVDVALSTEAFDAEVAVLPTPQVWLQDAASTPPVPGDWANGAGRRMPWRAAGQDRQLAAWLAACMELEHGCLWWTRGGLRVPPSALLTRGLPRPQAYAAFLDAACASGFGQTQGGFESVPSLAMPVATPARGAAPLPADLDDVLADLLPSQPDVEVSDTTLPGAVAVPATPDAPAPPAGTVAPARSGVVLRQVGAVTLLAADNGQPDPQRRAAASIGAILADAEASATMPQLRERLLTLHPSLRERSEDLINPVPEDGVAIIARMQAGQAELLRAGAAEVWHWRRGQLRPLFADAAAEVAPDQADTLRPGDLTGVLSGARVLPTPGLGTCGEPRCDEISCLVAPGDRLLLLATDTLMRIPAETLVAALMGATDEEVRARIAVAAGLGTDRAQWPLAVIEVGTT